MEQESTEERKPGNRKLMSDGFCSFAHFMAIVCIISCLVILFVSLTAMERRVTLLESKFSEISENSKNGVKEGDLHVRHERNANPTSTLSALTKRLISLESR